MFVKKVGDEALYHISRSGLATLTPLTPSGALPPIKAVGTPVYASRPDRARLEIKTSGNDPQVLRLRITDVPGWHATIDGKPLQLESYAGVMLQARVPAGDHTVVVRYWPSSLTVGIVLAIVSAVGLITVVSSTKSDGGGNRSTLRRVLSMRWAHAEDVLEAAGTE